MLQSKFEFDLLFHRGISPINSRNVNYFNDVCNLRPTEEGFQTIRKEEFQYLINAEGTQIFVLGNKEYLFTPSKIYLIQADGSLVLKLQGITIGGRWTKADYQTDGIFSNGVAIISIDSNQLVEYNLDIPKGRFCWNFNGQLVIGGFTLDINNIIPAIASSLEDAKSIILYSGIGSRNTTPSSTNPTAGFQTAVECGEILGICGNERRVIILCSDGIIALKPVEYYFGKETICEFGPRDENSWTMGNGVIYFIDKNGKFWSLGGDNELKLLGYGWLFKNLTTSLFYYPKEREVFITTSEKTFILGTKGLYSISTIVKGVGRLKLLVPASPDLQDAFCTLGPLDFKDPGMKIIEEISLGVDTGDIPQELSFYIYTKEKLGDAWTKSSAFRINNEGVCKPHVAGVEFKIELSCPAYTYASPSWMIVNYSKLDKRYNRGREFVDNNKE